MLNHSGLVSKSLDPYLGLVSDGLVGFPCQPLSSAPHFRDFSASSSLPPAFQSDSSRSFCTSSTSQPACSTGSEYHHLMSHHHLLPSTSTAIPMEISTTTSMALSSHAPLPPTSSIGEQFLSSLVSGPGPIVSRHSVACGPTGQAPSQLSFNSTVHSSLTGLQSTSPLKPLAPTASSLSGGSVAAPMSTTPMKTILSLQGSTKPKRKRVRTRSRPTKTSNAEASQDPSKVSCCLGVCVMCILKPLASCCMCGWGNLAYLELLSICCGFDSLAAKCSALSFLKWGLFVILDYFWGVLVFF